MQPKLQQLVTTASKLSYQELPSELEALLTEAELIKIYQPKFNSLLKDDKSALYIHITDEPLPRVEQVRKKQLSPKERKQAYFGPFPSAYQVTQVLKIARRIFRWCDRPQQSRADGCFYSHINLCSGVCSGSISAAEYQQSIDRLRLFLAGKSKQLLKQLAVDMRELAQHQHFEQAAQYRDLITAITNVTQAPYLLKPDPTPLALSDAPKTNQLAYLRRLLHLHLGMPKEYPLTRIEGYDVSNTSGTQAAVGMVCFTNGEVDLSQYRLFSIRLLQTPNDFRMLQEALLRRQNHPEWPRPDLIVIDGGKGQVRAALQVLQWSLPVIGIAKDPDRLVFPKVQPAKDRATKRLTIEYDIVQLEPTHPALQLVQHIRDETHRFSKKHHTRLRQRAVYSD